jgi:hypothetical protein
MVGRINGNETRSNQTPARWKLKPNDADSQDSRSDIEAVAAGASQPNLADPRVVMTLLEADQVVAAKRQSHFGQRRLSAGVRAMLWGLRAYVIVMLLIVLIYVLRVAHVVH